MILSDKENLSKLVVLWNEVHMIENIVSSVFCDMFCNCT